MTPPQFSIPYTAFNRETSEIKKELVEAFETVLSGGRYILGPEVAAFEQQFAALCGTKWAVSVASGTCALHLVFRALGIREGDEVITAPNSFLASASTIALAGARPVFVDILPDGNLNPALLDRAVTPRTKAILPVHLTGRVARMHEILEFAKRKGLLVIEDASQAVGATLNDKPAGGWGDLGCFSLHPLKNLHAYGDGGIITTNDGGVKDLLIKGRNHGLVNRERCEFWSFNCRLDEMQAALLRVQMRYLQQWTEARRHVAFRYNELLRPYVEVPEEGPGERCVYQTYVIKAERRDALKAYLNEQGVEALIHYATPIHLQPAAESLGYSAQDFPVTMNHVSRILSLPIYPSLSHEEQDRVVQAIGRFYRQAS